MKKKYIPAIVGLVAIVGIVVGASFAYDYLSDTGTGDMKLDVYENAPDGDADDDMLAPDFTMYDEYGNAVKLSDFRGKPVIVNFWATWCGPCKQELPAFENVYNEYGGEFEFLMVNLPDGESADEVISFVNGEGYSFPVYFDNDNEAAIAYGLNSIPRTLFVDSNGRGLGMHTGAMSEDILREYIRQVIEIEEAAV